MILAENTSTQPLDSGTQSRAFTLSHLLNEEGVVPNLRHAAPWAISMRLGAWILGAAIVSVPFESSAVAPSDLCTFDQAHQLAVLAGISKAFPGAKLDISGRTLSWGDPNSAGTEFSYGGCVDLGSVVVLSTRSDAPRTRRQVFAEARRLAKRFWSNEIVRAAHATDALLSALDSGQYSVESEQDVTHYRVDDPEHVQLSVTHAYRSGIDRITIAWQGLY
jgi:hypothetical protein